MLFKIDIEGKRASHVKHGSLADWQLRERYDLQEWILHDPTLLGEDLLIITSEFSGFDRTAERLDVLAIDKEGVLTVVELKRSAIGTAAELQALRYAAYCSTMSLKDVTEEMAKYESKRSKTDVTSADAEGRIKQFINEPDFAELADKPRIILGAEEFSPEITSTVLWLRTFNVNISCVRLRPYLLENQLLLESSVLIPLPEAKEYQIRREIKDAAENASRPRAHITPEEFLASANDDVQLLLIMLREWLGEQPEIQEKAFKSGLAYRKRSNGDWITWLQFTRSEARISIRPEVEVDPALLVKMSQDGWQVVRARSQEEVASVQSLLKKSMQFAGPIDNTARDDQ